MRVLKRIPFDFGRELGWCIDLAGVALWVSVRARRGKATFPQRMRGRRALRSISLRLVAPARARQLQFNLRRRRRKSYGVRL